MTLNKTSFLFVCRLSIVGIIFFISTDTFGQTTTNLNKSKVDVEIFGGQNGNLFTNRANLITLLSDDTTATFSVKSSQGIIWQLDKYMFFVDSLKKGKTTISVYKTNSRKKILVKQKNYSVLMPKSVLKYESLSVSPDISIGGFTSGKVKLDTLKKITALSINENYKLLQATFYIGQNDLTNYSIKSKYFDSHLKEIWKRIMPNFYITIDHIEFMDKNGNRYFYPRPISIMTVE